MQVSGLSTSTGQESLALLYLATMQSLAVRKRLLLNSQLNYFWLVVWYQTYNQCLNSTRPWYTLYFTGRWFRKKLSIFWVAQRYLSNTDGKPERSEIKTVRSCYSRFWSNCMWFYCIKFKNSYSCSSFQYLQGLQSCDARNVRFWRCKSSRKRPRTDRIPRQKVSSFFENVRPPDGVPQNHEWRKWRFQKSQRKQTVIWFIVQ